MNNTTQYIFGTRAIIEALKSGENLEKVYLQKGIQNSLISELKRFLKQEQINISYVPSEKLDKLSKQQNHQGAIASISPISYLSMDELEIKIIESKKTPLLLLLDQISDVRNFGAIIRTAECSGVDAIVIAGSGNAPINPVSIKTSAGAAFKVPICKVSHLKDAIYLLESMDIQLIAATEKANKNLYEIDLTKGTAIMMGSEDKGIHPSLLKLAGESVKIPLLGEIDSLNVSVACGVVLYEVVRQRL